ncbi:tRNA-specific adenosine deaminase [Leptodontidium sp. MPI-SDFR-AT-0119]|nr:tRNA-specific adenosine deaminase [Leptodontidium sp. MPI-SDFR-AT-0119]
MNISGDEIASVVLREFEKWPNKRKPLLRSDDVKEWVPLSGIVAQGKNDLVCLAVATGMKCLPQNKIAQAQGVTLHDWHAEVLAIRSFNRFLLEECYALASSEKASSEYIRFRTQDEITETCFQSFALNEDIILHMYCSEAPCIYAPDITHSYLFSADRIGGDSSMELTMAAQDDATPWDLPSKIHTPDDLSPAEPEVLHGRGYFSALGSVRRKPSRPDAPPSLSKSCSDKIALKQSTSLLSSITSLLISPKNVYIHSLVLPSSQHSFTACARAFSDSGRLSPLKDREWEGGYAFIPFGILTTDEEFASSRRQPLGVGEKIVPSNISTSWTPNHTETLIGGSLQGRKQFSLKGASRVCKRRSWKLALEIAKTASVLVPKVEEALDINTYTSVKHSLPLSKRREVKENVRAIALKGWIRNEGGEDWPIEGVEF